VNIIYTRAPVNHDTVQSLNESINHSCNQTSSKICTKHKYLACIQEIILIGLRTNNTNGNSLLVLLLLSHCSLYLDERTSSKPTRPAATDGRNKVYQIASCNGFETVSTAFSRFMLKSYVQRQASMACLFFISKQNTVMFIRTTIPEAQCARPMQWCTGVSYKINNQRCRQLSELDTPTLARMLNK